MSDRTGEPRGNRKAPQACCSTSQAVERQIEADEVLLRQVAGQHEVAPAGAFDARFGHLAYFSRIFFGIAWGPQSYLYLQCGSALDISTL